LAAYLAKQRNDSGTFEERIAFAAQRRRELAPTGAAHTWLDELAYQTGVPFEFILELNDAILAVIPNAPQSTNEWVRWLFTWVGEEASRIDAVIGQRLPQKLFQDFQGDLFGNKLVELVQAWLAGETLLQLNIRLGGDRAKPGKCILARRFVLKMVPELSSHAKGSHVYLYFAEASVFHALIADRPMWVCPSSFTTAFSVKHCETASPSPLFALK
jgi:hypothetical protein